MINKNKFSSRHRETAVYQRKELSEAILFQKTKEANRTYSEKKSTIRLNNKLNFNNKNTSQKIGE